VTLDCAGDTVQPLGPLPLTESMELAHPLSLF
jgi:hypothetical protein